MANPIIKISYVSPLFNCNYQSFVSILICCSAIGNLCLSWIDLNKLFVKNFLPIILIKAVEGKIEIYNAIGVVVKRDLIKNTNFTINLSDLTSGVYRLKHFDGTLFQKIN